MKKRREHQQKQEKIRRGQDIKELVKREYTAKKIDTEYEFCLKVGYRDVNCKLSIHFAIESQTERKRGKIFYTFFAI